MVTTLRVVRPFGPYRIGNTITDPVLVAQYLNDPNVVQVSDAGTPTPTPTPVPTPTPTPTPPPPPTPTPTGTVLSASNAAPAMNGTGSAGTSLDYMRADAVAPTDTSRYAANNPFGFQTAQQVGVSVDARVTTLIGTATATLDTFGEVAAKFAADESGVATLAALVSGHTTLLAAQAPRIPTGNAGAALGAAVLGADRKLPADVLPAGYGGSTPAALTQQVYGATTTLDPAIDLLRLTGSNGTYTLPLGAANRSIIVTNDSGAAVTLVVNGNQSVPILAGRGYGLMMNAGGTFWRLQAVLGFDPGAGSNRTTYTAAGPISPLDDRADINVPDGAAMTLAAPTVEGHRINIKRRGTGGFTLTANIDDAPGTTISTGKGSSPTAAKDVINLHSTLVPAPTWLVIA